MKFLLMSAAAALLSLSACGAPEGDEEEGDRTEQRDRDDDDG